MMFLNYSFIPRGILEKLKVEAETIDIKNPINEDMVTLRPTLMYGLLTNIKDNFNRNINDLKIFEVSRTFYSSIKKSIKGIKKYEGNAKEICEQIVNDCWNGKYFQPSNGHFNELWIRDLGWCSKSLVNQGFVSYNVQKKGKHFIAIDPKITANMKS